MTDVFVLPPQVYRTADRPVEQGPRAADHRGDPGRAADGVRRQRDGGVRVVRAGRHAAVAERGRGDLRPVHHRRVHTVRADGGQVRPAAAVHGLVRGHHRVPAAGVRAAVRGRDVPGPRVAAADQRVRRRVLHQHRADAAAVRRPVRVLPERHARPGQLRGGVHHHVHVHHHAQDIPADHGRVRQERQLHHIRRGHVPGRRVLLLLGAGDQGQVVPADPDRLRDVHVAQRQDAAPQLRAVLIASRPRPRPLPRPSPAPPRHSVSRAKIDRKKINKRQ